MRNYEFFAHRIEAEVAGFGKVLRAVPSEQFEYRPHEKSTSAGDLAWQIASEMVNLVDLLETGVADYRPGPRPATSDEIANTLEEGAQLAIERARSMQDERWKGPGTFLFAGHVAWEASVADIAWGFLLDLVHHRGQLTVYLRPMGAKVPSVYGPSGDEP